MIERWDGLLQMWMHPLLVLLLWSVVSAAFCMGVYALLSKQLLIAELKVAQKISRRNLLQYDGDMRGLWPLVSHDLALSLRQVYYAAIPFLAAVIPLLLLLSPLFELHAQTRYVDFGPEWAQGFVFWYFSSVTVLSLVLKRLFRLQ